MVCLKSGGMFVVSRRHWIEKDEPNLEAVEILIEWEDGTERKTKTTRSNYYLYLYCQFKLGASLLVDFVMSE